MGKGMHADLRGFYELHKDELTAANITPEDVAHALGLVSEGGREFVESAKRRGVRVFAVASHAQSHNNSLLHPTRR